MKISVKLIFAASTLSLAGFVGTNTANAQIPPHFRGVACIIGASSGCAAAGFEVGDCGKTRYHPPNMGGDGDNTTKISVFWSFYAQNFTSQGSIVGTTLRPAVKSGIGNGAFQIGTGTTQRILAQAPSNPTNAPFVYTVGQIIGFEPGCHITYRFSGPRRPGTTPAGAPADGLGNNGIGLDD